MALALQQNFPKGEWTGNADSLNSRMTGTEASPLRVVAGEGAEWFLLLHDRQTHLKIVCRCEDTKEGYSTKPKEAVYRWGVGREMLQQLEANC